ncbi:HAD-like domain-containing protein [Penicillium taxi]|uniref:HAD-like domain-containing protein n=1 Tax=Penicillium taxi TaxID=168475 RepID=UPI00254522FF|nr:HAD-like domain-containing protein [Penicillium taxi]KAJ5893750.1 HAD-like domain-containing protein [Penicillium taxi]
MQNLLSTKKWIGFDLDNTLHEFRNASVQASSSVFKAIVDENPNVTIEILASTYSDILRWKTSDAFTDGRTSVEYRRERFSHLLQVHGLESTEKLLARLLVIYQDSLKTGLKLKPGAMELLKKLKARGKNIIVVTEGPQDAQEWTISELGLRPYIDVLVTTNDIGKSKVDGLFPIVMEKYHIAASDIVYVGDSEQRDIVSARAAGMVTVLYDEKSNSQFDDSQAIRIDSLSKLGYLVD